MTDINNFNKKIGARIRDIRKEKKLEVEDMLVKLNISESTYLRMEKGETNTWATYLERLCTIFEIDEEEMLLTKDQYVQINKGKSSGNSGRNGSVIINQLPENFYENIKNDATLIADLRNEIKSLKKDNENLINHS